MPNQVSNLTNMQPGDVCCGFQLIKKEYMTSHAADCYTMRHEKSGAELLYFDRADENKTFSIAFKTLPEDNTGVFHILEHSLLNGSKKFPVKEPFVLLIQNSMQTFLNAMTFSDKTVFPVSSRNEQDLFHLMMVYLDGVFSPLIYERPEIFMQEGWHYEFEEGSDQPYYNGVVFSEMKGAFSDVDQLIDDESKRMLFPDNSYGYTSGGHPEHITDLTYEKFVETHKRFYHPANAKIILDGHMNVERFLDYMDREYLSNYEYQKPDFDFVMQEPKTAEETVFYEAQEEETEFSHMSIAKIFGTYRDTEKIYAVKILADYLAGSNEAPLKRAFLEQELAQDVMIMVNEQAYQPSVAVVAYNTSQDQFAKIKTALPEVIHTLAERGLDREALMASLERFAFENREISEPYGVELVIRALGSWLYGEDPLRDIENAEVFDALRKKVHSGYFEELLLELFGNAEDKSCLYVLPSTIKGEDDACREAEKLAQITASWKEEQWQQEKARFVKMQEWQQSMDSEEALTCLPHLELSDVPTESKQTETEIVSIAGREVLNVQTENNGIVYLNLYFDISDFSTEELRMVNAISPCLGELGTEHYSGDKIQTKIKGVLGQFGAKIEVLSKPGDLTHSRQYLLVSAAMLEENAAEGMEIIEELLLNGRYDETDKIYETVLQNDYLMKQSLIGNGHLFAMTRALSAFSGEGAVKELLEGESFVRWFSDFTVGYMEQAKQHSETIAMLMKKAFAANRLFVGYSGKLDKTLLEQLVQKLPEHELGACVQHSLCGREDSTITIPSDVGYSALGHNVYALGSKFNGHWAVLSSILSFGYLWNMIRVQGSAYGTGISVRLNGDIFSYSYRDPNLENTAAVYQGMADFLQQFLDQGMPFGDIIIGTVGMVDPLLPPAGICDVECIRYLKDITKEDMANVRREILHTTAEDLQALLPAMEHYTKEGKICVVADKERLKFMEQ